MSFRVDTLEDGTIEITRLGTDDKVRHPKYDTISRALVVIEYFLKCDRARSKKQRFEPQFTKEARAAFKQLSDRSPFNGKTK